MKNMDSILAGDAEKVLSNVDFSQVSGKTIMLTGASGLIGSHILCSIVALAMKGVYVPEMVYVITYSDLPKHLEFIKSLNYVTIVRGDLTDPDFISELPTADYIFHAAGYASPGVFMKDQIKTIKINTSTVIGLINKLKQPLKDSKFIYMSSSSVYTGSNSLPYSEFDKCIGNTNTTHPRACYIEGKKCGEVICNSYRSAGYNVKSVRLSVVYGPGTKSGDVRAMNSFIRSAITDGEIHLMDSGNAKKAFLYVSDAVEIIWKILLYGENPIYNLGGSEIVSIADIANIIAKYCNSKVVFGDDIGVSGALMTELLDMKSVEKELGKDSYINIIDGLHRTIDWVKEYYC